MFHRPLRSINLDRQETEDLESMYVRVAAPHNGYLQAGFVVEQLRLHWFTCPNCPIATFKDAEIGDLEDASWIFREQDDFDVVDSDITGWEWLRHVEKSVARKGKRSFGECRTSS